MNYLIRKGEKMGQRSQIFVRMNDKNGEKHLIAARDFGWNYGIRMISRARGIVEWMDSYYINYPEGFLASNCREYRNKLKGIIEVNFDMKDIVLSSDIIEEFKSYGEGFDFYNFAFAGIENDDGVFLLDCIIDYDNKGENGNYKYELKYAFLPRDFHENERTFDALAYMDWESESYIKPWRECEADFESITDENAKFISEHASLMTSDEAYEFCRYDYKIALTKPEF